MEIKAQNFLVRTYYCSLLSLKLGQYLKKIGTVTGKKSQYSRKCVILGILIKQFSLKEWIAIKMQIQEPALPSRDRTRHSMTHDSTGLS